MTTTDQPTPTPRTDDAQFGTGRVSVAFAQRLERELAAERALADKLAETLANVQGDYASTGGITTLEVDEALAAWKGARNEA